MLRVKVFAFVLTIFVFVHCGGEEFSNGITEVPDDYEPDLYQQAVEIAHSTIILDGHVDVPYRLNKEMEDISQATEEGNFDYPRAKAGGLDAPFMSIYIPAELQKTPGASKQHADKLIAMTDSIMAANPERFAPAHNPDDVRENFEKGLISFAYGMENGSGIEDDLTNVEYFYKKGIRYITLTHAKKNQICDSSYDPNKVWNGLSPFGKKMVAEMNRLGIMVDISHVSDSTFYQVLRLTEVPVICSHSSCRHFTPGWERNVSDDMLRELAKNGGVIQINFGSSFLTEKANKYDTKKYAYLGRIMEEHGITSFGDSLIEAELEKYEKENPYPYADIIDVIDHIDHAVNVAGIDHVGLGSDFDGVGETLPTDLKSVADYPKLIYHLLKRGYSESDIEKILSGNVLRVWEAVGEYSQNNRQMSE
ncbi:membrane dipeptidase [candidate division KSB1 bacterium]|nr:membrane dipeptidase [candidate division KSB1 bacterium]NIR73246.1 membrane dipeptidase [candidate division KSB1 bacterium]NIS26952.1 membrane dipeptidase [candidate division KSB1 bacterium]NIT73790.1 membrane dipeptidase [candidate division KSB1 bacterium]NIU27696.1 membrane dipeptidase [candidate division KSB1 bacterium]